MGRLLLLLFVFAAVAAAAMATSWPSLSSASNHVVGEPVWSYWSVPPTVSFYTDWSNTTSLLVGDLLVFRFETGLADVVQVSRRELEDCVVENPFQTFLLGPATIHLDRPQLYYFICTLADYCRLGMKLAVTVQPAPVPAPPSHI